MQTLYLRGEDVGSRSYWAWEWSDGSEPQFAVLERERLAPLLTELDAALPGLLSAEVELTREELLDHLDHAEGLPEDLRKSDQKSDSRLREVLMVHRCMTGALAQSDAEADLAKRLGAALLPADLVSTIRERSEEFGPDAVEVRVMPAPSYARVPWELLGIDAKGTRLLDYARVVTMAPLLGRDGDPSVPHPDWSHIRDRPALYVVDPLLTKREKDAILDRRQAAILRRDLRGASPAAGVSVQSHQVDRDWLSSRLREPRSRFMYIGHVVANEATAGKTALRLNDSAQMYGLGGRHDRYRDLTAQDLLAGTIGRDKVFNRLANQTRSPRDAAIHDEFDGWPRYPAGALDADGKVNELPGRDLWPVPPRAALIACGSGVDVGHVEPFGLVTALLENGAELVTATRWTLLVDRVFSDWGSDSTPLLGMAVAVDGAHQREDPLSALATWQRTRLADWRDRGRLADAPLCWAALTTYHAPDRAFRPEDAQE
jgi:hypothetical protein